MSLHLQNTGGHHSHGSAIRIEKYRTALIGTAQFWAWAKRAACTVALLAASVLPIPCAALAQETPVEKGQVLATVAGKPIYVRDVERRLQEQLARSAHENNAVPLRAARRLQLEKQVLEHLIEQRLVLLHLEEMGEALAKAEIDLELDRLKKSLQRRMLSLETYLKRQDLSIDQLRDTIEWRVSWSRYLNAKLTDKLLQAYFRAHARAFDGSQLRVSHILLKPEAGALPMQTALRVRASILAGDLTFVEAAAKYSASPSGKKGGDIGLIARFEPMPESFSKAAFGLKKNEISEPVESAFGLHLITVTEITPGKKSWRDVRSELAKAATRRLFQQAAQKQRPRAKIKRAASPPGPTSPPSL